MEVSKIPKNNTPIIKGFLSHAVCVFLKPDLLHRNPMFYSLDQWSSVPTPQSPLIINTNEKKKKKGKSEMVFFLCWNGLAVCQSHYIGLARCFSASATFDLERDSSHTHTAKKQHFVGVSHHMGIGRWGWFPHDFMHGSLISNLNLYGSIWFSCLFSPLAKF